MAKSLKFMERETGFEPATFSLGKGNQNEIDLVAVNDLKKTLTIAEIKLNKARRNPVALKKKTEKLIASFQGYEVRWLALGMEDAGEFL